MLLRTTIFIGLFCVWYFLIGLLRVPNGSIMDENEHSNVSLPPSLVKAVLVTYHRGGSTFLGELFNQNPQAFYWYEPLASVVSESSWKLRINQEQLYFTNNGDRRWLPKDILQDLTQSVINILNCNFEDLDPHILTHYFVSEWEKSNKMLPFKKCLTDHSVKFATKTKLSIIISKCVIWLKEACTKSHMRVIKTIRLPAFVAEQVLKKDPSVRLIYYTRDIRGILVSRSKFNNVNLTSMDEIRYHSIRQCAWMRHDVREFKNMNKTHEVLQMKYEDLALRPYASAYKVYQFLHYPYPMTLNVWLHENTEAEKDNGLLETARKSAVAAFDWQKQLSPHANNVIIEHCKDVLQHNGYSLDF